LNAVIQRLLSALETTGTRLLSCVLITTSYLLLICFKRLMFCVILLCVCFFRCDLSCNVRVCFRSGTFSTLVERCGWRESC
jgi:hypothetical protein